MLDKPLVRGRSHIVKYIYSMNEGKYTKKDIDIIVRHFLQALFSCVEDGDSIMFKELGSFKLNYKRGRKVRNPSTGELMDIKSKKTVKFKPSKALETLLNT